MRLTEVCFFPCLNSDWVALCHLSESRSLIQLLYHGQLAQGSGFPASSFYMRQSCPHSEESKWQNKQVCKQTKPKPAVFLQTSRGATQVLCFSFSTIASAFLLPCTLLLKLSTLSALPSSFINHQLQLEPSLLARQANRGLLAACVSASWRLSYSLH